MVYHACVNSTITAHCGVFTCTNLNYILSYDLKSQVKQLGHMCFSLYAEMHQSVVLKKKKKK